MAHIRKLAKDGKPTGRWYALRHTTASPRSVGDIVRAALVLTQFEYRYLPNSR